MLHSSWYVNKQNNQIKYILGVSKESQTFRAPITGLMGLRKQILIFQWIMHF